MKPVRVFIILLISFLYGCATSQSSNQTCAVYTYINSPGHNLSGLIYLDEKLEIELRALLPNDDSEENICWYTFEKNIQAVIEYSLNSGITYTFIFNNNVWELKGSDKNFILHGHRHD